MIDVDWLLVVSAVLVAALSTARLTRLLTLDSYPPVAWVRTKWAEITNDGPWYDLVECPYCAAPWFALVVGGWGVLSDLHWTWWAFNGWLALAYIAAIIVVRESSD